MTIIACVKNKRTSSLPQNPSPVALLFKDKKGLANHPLSCHPQGVFGKRESERKMRERKIGGKAESFRPQNLLHKVILLYTIPRLSLIYCSKQGKLQKSMKY